MARFALLLALLGGCSIALQSKPTKPAVASKGCSTTSAFWVADAVGVAAGVAALAAGIVVASRDTDDSTGNLIAGAGGMVGIGYLASMGNGIAWTNECRDQQPATTALR